MPSTRGPVTAQGSQSGSTRLSQHPLSPHAKADQLGTLYTTSFKGSNGSVRMAAVRSTPGLVRQVRVAGISSRHGHPEAQWQHSLSCGPAGLGQSPVMPRVPFILEGAPARAGDVAALRSGRVGGGQLSRLRLLPVGTSPRASHVGQSRPPLREPEEKENTPARIWSRLPVRRLQPKRNSSPKTSHTSGQRKECSRARILTTSGGVGTNHCTVIPPPPCGAKVLLPEGAPLTRLLSRDPRSIKHPLPLSGTERDCGSQQQNLQQKYVSNK